MSNLKGAYVQFKDSKYNYKTSVNGKLTDKQIKQYFEGQTFNLGGIGYDHETEQETEIDNLQTCIKCEVLK